MKLHFEEENLSEKQECSALTSNLEGTALSCVMAKRANERDSARKIFDNKHRQPRVFSCEITIDQPLIDLV